VQLPLELAVPAFPVEIQEQPASHDVPPAFGKIPARFLPAFDDCQPPVLGLEIGWVLLWAGGMEAGLGE
jgi:hypothetical protein